MTDKYGKLDADLINFQIDDITKKILQGDAFTVHVEPKSPQHTFLIVEDRSNGDYLCYEQHPSITREHIFNAQTLKNSGHSVTRLRYLDETSIGPLAGFKGRKPGETGDISDPPRKPIVEE